MCSVFRTEYLVWLLLFEDEDLIEYPREEEKKLRGGVYMHFSRASGPGALAVELSSQSSHLRTTPDNDHCK